MPNAARSRRRRQPRSTPPAAAGGWSRSARPASACWKALRARTACVQPFSGDTTLFILPGYRFRAVDLLLTNFHLPRSTLFMLVCAFAGTERMRAAYAHAIEAGYRFYSYGDACLLEPPMTVRRAFRFIASLSATDGAARAGVLHTAHGDGRHAGLHAGRHRRHGEGDDRRTRCAPPAPTSCSATPIT